MQDPSTLYEAVSDLVHTPQIRGLNLIIGLTGAAEAGQAADQIRAELLDRLEHELVIEFDADALYDYRGRRPIIGFEGDHFTDYERPRLQMHALKDETGQPFLMLSGFEPDYQWERFAGAVVELVQQLDVQLVSWVHSLPLPVPHTRPLAVTAHGNRPDLIDRISAWKPTARMPASAGQLLEVRLTEAGKDVVGFAVHVPHYLAEARFPQAAVTGLEHLSAAAALMLPSDRLREAGRELEKSIDEQVAASAEVQQLVSGLQAQYDEYHRGREPRRSLLEGPDGELPDADELGAAVEAYLATMDAGDADQLTLDTPPADPDDDGGDPHH
ncbi:PAC2 family protein [Tersicoccus phoenicis]|uniref:PAC2 family protein n=1 Tax=Tersicoccus phoenicis TaxID=554083 RepID=A0A1R1LJV0_9MICC|nr:PAC2 family protein [Tersicoccus phoenicis]OMH27817.1 PAC2 family protein [Tersicoccus phoenicis]